MQPNAHSETAQAADYFRGRNRRGIIPESTFRQAVRELEGMANQVQKLMRKLDQEDEADAIRFQLSALKRSVSEHLPTIVQAIAPTLAELEFWEPGILSRFQAIWLAQPYLIQGPCTWLRFLGTLRTFLLEWMRPVEERVTDPAAHRANDSVEPARTSPGSESVRDADQHFTPKQLADLWGLDQSTIRRLFRDEAGVFRMPHLRRRGKRDYVSLRIPASVADRVHERRSRSLFKV